MPYMDPANEVENEGLNVGKNLKGLVHNVEDMYLYMDEMSSEIEELKKENEELKALVLKIIEDN